MRVLRVSKTPESQLCAYTKNVLFSSSTLLDQRFSQFISKVLINYKDHWSNKAELENIAFFVYAHNCDSGVLRTRMTLIGYGKSLVYTHLYSEKIEFQVWKLQKYRFHTQFRIRNQVFCYIKKRFSVYLE